VIAQIQRVHEALHQLRGAAASAGKEFRKQAIWSMGMWGLSLYLVHKTAFFLSAHSSVIYALMREMPPAVRDQLIPMLEAIRRSVGL
jgi:hypothetical protein